MDDVDPLADPRPVVLAGATGFVGEHLATRLGAEGVPLRCGSRDPERAARRAPHRTWVRLDVHDPDSLGPALEGARALVYLVHGLGRHDHDDLLERERQAARSVVEAASAAGVERIVYLGGPVPPGDLSPHLAARAATGELLRSGEPSCIELRAGMVVGHGSESWQICRDLALRLPVMIAPRWVDHVSSPVGIDDVVLALRTAVHDPLAGSAAFDLPGPEVLSARCILERVAAQAGLEPVMIPVPVLTPRLSSLWLRFVSGANYAIARQLVDGFTTDLIGHEPSYWPRVPDAEGVAPTPFDEAVRRALREAPPPEGWTALLERVALRLARRPRSLS